MMRALTVIQPWGWCIAYAGKPLENRTWPPPPSLKVGDLLAFHSGKKVDRKQVEWFRKYPDLTRGRLCPEPEKLVTGAIESVVTYHGLGPAHHSNRWADRKPGTHHWLFGLLHVLKTPVPCRGMQGLWALPPDVEREVRRQLDEAQNLPSVWLPKIGATEP